MQEIRLQYFFLPIRLQIQSNPGADEVVVLQPTILGIFEFLRLPVDAAREMARLLEVSADNASATPVDAGLVGETNGIYVRRLGTGRIRLRFSVKRAGSVRIGVRQTVGFKSGYSWPKISVHEARRFASALRDANVVGAKPKNIRD